MPIALPEIALPEKTRLGPFICSRLLRFFRELHILFQRLTRRFVSPLLVVLVLILVTNCLILMNIPVLRPVFGFITLSIIPGMLLLHALGIDPGSTGKYLGYCLGVSLSFLVLVVLFIHAVYPLFGIVTPLSLIYLLPTVSAFLLAFVYIAYRNRAKKISFPLPELRSYWSPVTFALILVLLLSILGSYWMNYFGDNAVNLVYIVAVGAVTFGVASKRVSTNYYSLMIYVIMLSLLLHRNLISDYIIGADSQLHFYYANQILLNQFWDFRVGSLSTLLVTSAVPAIYSIICGVNLHWVFKLFYSLIFAFVPVGIYYVFRPALGAKTAALGALFFAFYYRSYDISPDKQYLSEFFLVLILMLLITVNISRHQRYFLLVIFFFSMVVSHYGVSLIFLLALVSAYLITCYIWREGETRVISKRLIGIYLALYVVWFTFVGSGEVISHLLDSLGIGYAEIQAYLFESGYTPLHRTGASYTEAISQVENTLFQINVGLYFIMTFLIIIGVGSLLRSVLHKQKISLNYQILGLIFPFFAFLGISYLINAGMGADRAYQISLVLLSPIVVFGYLTLCRAFTRVFKGTQPSDEARAAFEQSPATLIPAVVLLVLLLLFNTGLVYQISGYPVDSAISINTDSNSLAYLQSEMVGAAWLHGNSGFGNPTPKNIILADDYGYFLLLEFYSSIETLMPFSDVPISVLYDEDFRSERFIYVRNKCIIPNVSISVKNDGYLTANETSLLGYSHNLIYDSNGCAIYSH